MIIVGVVLLLFVFFRGNYGFIRLVQLQKQKKELLAGIVDLRKQRDELNIEIKRLLKDYRHIEKIVREKYKMGKEGEKIYFMIDQAKSKKPSDAP